jgi:ribonuclease E
MVDTNDSESLDSTAETRPRRRAASRPSGPPQPVDETAASTKADKADKADKPVRKSTRKASATKAVSAEEAPVVAPASAAAEKNARKSTKSAARKTSSKAVAAKDEAAASGDVAMQAEPAPKRAVVAPLFQAPQAPAASDVSEPTARRRGRRAAKPIDDDSVDSGDADATDDFSDDADSDGDEGRGDGGRRRRRRRGGRGRKRRTDESGDREDSDGEDGEDSDGEDGEDSDGEDGEGRASRRRRRRRRRGSDGEDGSPDDPPNTVVRVREPRGRDEVTSLKGSTRLEAKKQRRREGREAGRRRAPILTEAEFLARREAVNRVMAVRQHGERTQIAVLEDGVLVEHYVTRGSASSMVGNVYLGRVQNVLPSMEAAFIDIGRGRNAVLYAGEVNWDAAGLEGQPKRIELALKSGDPILVQITKDPVGQKGARLTSQISLPGRFLVYVPDGSMTGISRKLPDNERSRLKGILKRVMPEDAGVIVRTAAEGAPEASIEQDVERLAAQWTKISEAAATAVAPALLHGEPDLAIKVVRDLFNEDVNSLIVSGDTAWESVTEYIGSVAPDLVPRLEHWVSPTDLFAEHRVEEQLLKALDRKVYLPSGGSLVIDRTEAMTVIDVNTGKFTGQGGNLEQTVTRNNLEAAEEIVRQLRLRDIGGIIVVDFIDMVLESNRDLVLRRLVECLGRDRTKHQVAEVTSLGLVQMTRKRIGSGLIESFSETCEHCAGRGIRVSLDHEHELSPRHRRPANAVDPADVAARAYEAAHSDEGAAEEAEEPV